MAEPVAAPPDGDKWLHEIKLNGYRMVCRKEGKKVHFLSRSNEDWTTKVGSLAKEAAGLKTEAAILDGEVVVTLPDGRPNFHALQNALGDSKSDRIAFYTFDLLHLDGFDLTKVKLEERKRLLQRLVSVCAGRADGSRGDSLQTARSALFHLGERLPLCEIGEEQFELIVE